MAFLKFAVVENNVCIDVIGAESLEQAEFFSNKTCYLIPEFPEINPNESITSIQFAEIQAANVSIGWTFDEDKNIFIPPKPFESWILNEYNVWKAPVPVPSEDEFLYAWNEESVGWDLVPTDPESSGA